MELLLYAMVIHFVADFLMQSREMGQKKSSDIIWLLRHLIIQWAMFFIFMSPFVGGVQAMLFATMNAIIHGMIDWNIWRIYKLSAHKRIVSSLWKKGNYSKDTYDVAVKDWRYWEDHLFYSTIGFDQLLHVSTIIILVEYML